MYIKRLRPEQIERLVDFRKSREYTKALQIIVHREFLKQKKELIRNFSKHPVTVEIEGGIGASNLSNTLNGKGNLFSFIGFNSSDKPLFPIYQKLESIELTSTIIKKDGRSTSIILFPTAEDIFSVTPMPWADGLSWAEGIEKGIPNLGQYLFKETDKSRSGRGIQSESQVSGATFSPTLYIGSMIKKFENTIKNLNQLTVT